MKGNDKDRKKDNVREKNKSKRIGSDKDKELNSKIGIDKIDKKIGIDSVKITIVLRIMT